MFAQTEISGWNPRVRRFTPHFRQISDSLPLSELSPYREISPTACFLRSPSLPPLHLERSIILNRDGNKCDVILQNGCACAPGLTRPPYPTLLFGLPNRAWVLGADLGSEFPSPKHYAKGLTQLGLPRHSTPHLSTLLTGGISLLTSSTVGLCPPTKLLEASGPIPAP